MTTATNAVPPAPGLEDGGAQLFRWLRLMRDEHPVHVDEYGTVSVYRHADVVATAADHELFSSDLSRLRPDSAALSEQILSVIDPPLHRKLRRLVSQAFTRASITALEPRIVEVATELLDAVPGDRFDLVTDFAYPLPVIVIAELLGVPSADRELFRSWSQRMLSIQVDDVVELQFGDESGQDYEDLVRSPMREMHAYFQERLDERRVRSGPDLLSALALAEVDGERLTDTQIVEFAGLLLMAGHVSTSMLLGNLVLCLEGAADAAAAVRRDRSLVPGAVDEAMRLRPPITMMARVTTRDTTLAGVSIPAGRMVTPSIVSANQDERRFADADRFDVHRASGNEQLAFGHGIHYCLGAPLARLEGRLALNLLLDRFADIRITPGAAIPFHRHGLLGPSALPLTVRRS
jgi:cytochrome P450